MQSMQIINDPKYWLHFLYAKYNLLFLPFDFGVTFLYRFFCAIRSTQNKENTLKQRDLQINS